MILHIATFRWKDSVTSEDVASLTHALRDMATQIPQLASYVAGANLHLTPAGADYAVAALVEDGPSLSAYLDHALHAAVYASHLSRMIEERVVSQMEIEEGTLR